MSAPQLSETARKEARSALQAYCELAPQTRTNSVTLKLATAVPVGTLLEILRTSSQQDELLLAIQVAERYWDIPGIADEYLLRIDEVLELIQGGTCHPKKEVRVFIAGQLGKLTQTLSSQVDECREKYRRPLELLSEQFGPIIRRLLHDSDTEVAMAAEHSILEAVSSDRNVLPWKTVIDSLGPVGNLQPSRASECKFRRLSAAVRCLKASTVVHRNSVFVEFEGLLGELLEVFRNRDDVLMQLNALELLLELGSMEVSRQWMLNNSVFEILISEYLFNPLVSDDAVLVGCCDMLTRFFESTPTAVSVASANDWQVLSFVETTLARSDRPTEALLICSLDMFASVLQIAPEVVVPRSARLFEQCLQFATASSSSPTLRNSTFAALAKIFSAPSIVELVTIGSGNDVQKKPSVAQNVAANALMKISQTRIIPDTVLMLCKTNTLLECRKRMFNLLEVLLSLETSMHVGKIILDRAKMREVLLDPNIDSETETRVAKYRLVKKLVSDLGVEALAELAGREFAVSAGNIVKSGPYVFGISKAEEARVATKTQS